ncbi:MAG: DUF4340 domain-containing protein [Saprospiraceae bacterium]|jgi:hypothetical protein|nr:DUF4340 domain-containing protein [Saprospiraceae bacterium]
MKNKHLVIIFAMLLVAVYFSRKQFGKRERSFESVLIEADTSAVSSIVIKAPGEAEFSLVKEAGKWILTDGRRNISAEAEPVRQLLAALMKVETQQVVAKDKDLWTVYGVDDAHATRVKLYERGTLTQDFLLGNEDLDAASQSTITFLRISDEKAVFVVDGFQMSHIGKTFNSYRNRLLLRMKREMEMNAFLWESPDTTLAFERGANGWTLGGTVLDSMAVEEYLNAFRNISADDFADDFDELEADDKLHKRLVIKGKNIPGVFEITCFSDAARKPPFVLVSSQNPKTFFSSDSTGLYGKIFPAVEGFYKMQ